MSFLVHDHGVRGIKILKLMSKIHREVEEYSVEALLNHLWSKPLWDPCRSKSLPPPVLSSLPFRTSIYMSFFFLSIYKAFHHVGAFLSSTPYNLSTCPHTCTTVFFINWTLPSTDLIPSFFAYGNHYPRIQCSTTAFHITFVLLRWLFWGKIYLYSPD